MSNVNEIIKIDAIIQEVEAAYAHLTDGIRYLNTQKSAILNNHVPLQNFASGFERLIKVLLLIKEKHTLGKFPQLEKSSNYFKIYRNGHGIKEMIDELLKYSKTVDLMQRIPMVVTDLEYLERNQVFVELMEILSDFAHRNRYDNIDTILQNEPIRNSNYKTPFDKFRGIIYSFSELLDVSNMTEREEEREILKMMIIHIERGIRGLARFFTHGLGDQGRMFYGDFSVFIFMSDTKLGELEYLKPKHDAQIDYKPITKSDRLFKSILANSKSIQLSSDEYEEWPFKIDFLKVLNFNNSYYLTEIDNEIYALNGNAVSYFKIPLYFASKHLKPRKYATYLLDVAKSL